LICGVVVVCASENCGVRIFEHGVFIQDEMQVEKTTQDGGVLISTRTHTTTVVVTPKMDDVMMLSIVNELPYY